MSEFKMPTREQISNKRSFGRVINFSGTNNYIGASYLSTLSVLKSGAGFVALASEKNVINTVSAMLPEAVYLSRKEGTKCLKNFDVCIIGCGLGTGIKAVCLLKKVLPILIKENIPTILDADGLNILSGLKLKLNKNFIITPHPLEALRLLKNKYHKLEFIDYKSDKVMKEPDIQDILSNTNVYAKILSEMYNCTVVLKTHRTVICDGEHTFINQHGNSALAKAGSGDVLSGIIAGLLAQKMEAFEGAKLGVYLHSRAGEIASNELTEYSVLASDIPKFLVKAIKEVIS